MKRTTVKIPEELDARLRQEARRRGSTISEVTREALETHLAGGGRDNGPPHRPFLEAMIGSMQNGGGDLSKNVDEVVRRKMRAEYEEQREDFLRSSSTPDP